MKTSWEEITNNTGTQHKRRRADYEPSRVRRIAKGAGRKESEVKELLQKFASMRQMKVQLGASTGLMGKIPGFKGASVDFNRNFLGAKYGEDGGTAIVFKAEIHT